MPPKSDFSQQLKELKELLETTNERITAIDNRLTTLANFTSQLPITMKSWHESQQLNKDHMKPLTLLRTMKPS